MNRSALLKKAKALGYKGKPEFVPVSEFFAEYNVDGIVIGKKADGTDETATLKEIWAKTTTLTLDPPENDGAEDEEFDEAMKAERAEKAAEAEALAKKSTREHYTPGKGWANGPGRGVTKGAGVRDKRSIAKKTYEMKARRGEAIYADVDVAEGAGAFFRLASIGNMDYPQKKLDIEICEKAGSTVVNTLGGSLVDPEYYAGVMWATEQYGVARKLANVVRMTSDEQVHKRRTGLVSFAAVAENGAITATDNTYDNVSLTAKKAGILVQESSELMEDAAVSVADEYAKTFGEAQAIWEDKCWVLGDGSATYAGNVGLTAGLEASTSYISATGSGWSSYVEADFLLAIGSVENVDPRRLAGLCSRQFFIQVVMKVANAKSGTTPNAVLGPMPGFSWSGGSLYGYPIMFCQIMPTATAGSESRAFYFGDFMGGSMIGDRRQLTIATSEHRYFDSDQIAIRATNRICVNVNGDGRGSTFGPIVALTST